MRIARVANFVSPTSGGIKTTLDQLALGYAAHGHQVALVIPGAGDAVHDTDSGTVVTVRSPLIPRSGGYRIITDLGRVKRILKRYSPDRLEVHDRFTLRGLGPWARQLGVPTMAVIHERLDRLAGLYLPWVMRPQALARRDNLSLAGRFDTIVCPSRWSAREFAGGAVQVVSWGVDLGLFHPDRRSQVLRRRLLADQTVLVAMVCRLSAEKNPLSALKALEHLRSGGVNARLLVAGTGLLEKRMRRQASGLPVTFLGHVKGRGHVAELLASADVAICPGPLETFGLAALESLASGTPVVGSRAGAVAELLDHPYGEAAYNHGPAMAGALARLLQRGGQARHAARRRAESCGWPSAVRSMLDLHGLAPAGPPQHPGVHKAVPHDPQQQRTT
ncbi:MAG: glycosyltransferase [Euzebya sp.]